jgi:hypothetical protein
MNDERKLEPKLSNKKNSSDFFSKPHFTWDNYVSFNAEKLTLVINPGNQKILSDISEIMWMANKIAFVEHRRKEKGYETNLSEDKKSLVVTGNLWQAIDDLKTGDPLSSISKEKENSLLDQMFGKGIPHEKLTKEERETRRHLRMNPLLFE